MPYIDSKMDDEWREAVTEYAKFDCRKTTLLVGSMHYCKKWQTDVVWPITRTIKSSCIRVTGGSNFYRKLWLSWCSLNRPCDFTDLIKYKPTILERISKIFFFLWHNFIVRHIKILSYLLIYHHLFVGCSQLYIWDKLLLDSVGCYRYSVVTMYGTRHIVW